MVNLSKNKFKARKRYLDINCLPCPKNEAVYSFDSGLEHDTFLALKNMGCENIKLHYPIPIIQSGIKENSIDWCIDFIVDDKYYIECKGIRTESFMLKLKLFREFQPKLWRNFYLVVPQGMVSVMNRVHGLKLEKKTNKIITLGELKNVISR